MKIVKLFKYNNDKRQLCTRAACASKSKAKEKEKEREEEEEEKHMEYGQTVA